MAKKRRDINDLDVGALEDYIHALNILRARSAADPDDETGYDFQAGLHNDVFIGPCEHGSDFFLPWHRAHLHYFEKLLQAADPPRTQNVTIPYWDWLHSQTSGKFPAAFSERGLFMDGRNPNPTSLPPDTLQIVTQESNWSDFGGYPKGDPNGDYGRLELGPHNMMHGFFIGGRMSNPSTAAEDPIYWSFHAFIDLLWAEWQRRNGMPPPTTPQGNLRGFLTMPKHKIQDFQNPTDLDFEYEYTQKLKEAFGVIQEPHEGQELVAAEPLRPLFTEGLAAEMQSAARAQFALPAAPAATKNAVVRLRNLKVPITGSYMLQAYVHPKDVAFDKNDPEFRRRYGVGYVSLWKAHGAEAHHTGHEAHAGQPAHGGHPSQPHHPSTCTVRFNVTKVLAATAPDQTGNLVLTLHYIPAPGPTGEPQADTELVKEVQLQDVVLEAYAQP
jgi:tyrosinase